MTTTDDRGPAPSEVEDFWLRAIAAGIAEPRTPPPVVERFGDSSTMADALLDLVAHGPKRATAGALADYQHHGDPLPVVGGHWIVADGRDRPRLVLETTDVRIGPLSSVDDAFAWDEGEGDRTRADWLRMHEGYFRRYLPTIGVPFHDDIDVVFERFALVYAEEEAGSSADSETPRPRWVGSADDGQH